MVTGDVGRRRRGCWSGSPLRWVDLPARAERDLIESEAAAVVGDCQAVSSREVALCAGVLAIACEPFAGHPEPNACVGLTRVQSRLSEWRGGVRGRGLPGEGFRVEFWGVVVEVGDEAGGSRPARVRGFEERHALSRRCL